MGAGWKWGALRLAFLMVRGSLRLAEQQWRLSLRELL